MKRKHERPASIRQALNTSKERSYTNRQHYCFSYRLKMGSMQYYGAAYTYLNKIKGAAHKSGDVEGTCKQAFNTVQMRRRF